MYMVKRSKFLVAILFMASIFLFMSSNISAVEATSLWNDSNSLFSDNKANGGRRSTDYYNY